MEAPFLALPTRPIPTMLPAGRHKAARPLHGLVACPSRWPLGIPGPRCTLPAWPSDGFQHRFRPSRRELRLREGKLLSKTTWQ